MAQAGGSERSQSSLPDRAAELARGRQAGFRRSWTQHDFCRGVNELILDLVEGGPTNVRFVCECADTACFAKVAVPASEFRVVASMPGAYVVVPGHAAGAEVLEHRASFDVVSPDPVEPDLVADLVARLPGGRDAPLQHPHAG